MTTTFRVNGEELPFEAVTVRALLQRLNVNADARGAAVAVNGAVVPRREWDVRQLCADDEIDVVRPYSGG